MSHQERPSVAGGLISQANRPLARHSRGHLEGSGGLSQSQLASQWGVGEGTDMARVPQRNSLSRKTNTKTKTSSTGSGEISKKQSERKCYPLPCQPTKQLSVEM